MEGSVSKGEASTFAHCFPLIAKNVTSEAQICNFIGFALHASKILLPYGKIRQNVWKMKKTPHRNQSSYSHYKRRISGLCSHHYTSSFSQLH